jgi:hypothetical protein
VNAAAVRREQALTIGQHLARQFFAKRGNNSEVHVNEQTLAALLALAAERGLELQPVRRG